MTGCEQNMGAGNLFRLVVGGGRKVMFSVGPRVIRRHSSLSKAFIGSQKGGALDSISLGEGCLARIPETSGASNFFSATKWLCDLNQSLNY